MHNIVLLVSTLLSAAVASAGSGAGLQVSLSTDGGVALSVNDQRWLYTNTTGVFVRGTMQTNHNGGLQLLQTKVSTGYDPFGSFQRTVFEWQVASTGEPVRTAVRDYTDGGIETVIFEQHFPKGVSSIGSNDRDAVGTEYPVFETPAGDDGMALGYLTWAGNMACPNATRECTYSGRLNSSKIEEIPGGISGGAPLVLFDSTSEQNALVISPASNFMAASHVYKNGAVHAGLLGSVTSIPADYTLETIVHAGQGVTQTMLEWGRGLLHRFGKEPICVLSDRDRTIDYLSYYTDNGATYYYCTEDGKSYSETLEDVAAHMVKEDIPIRSMQLDSWWYFKGLTLGVTNWTAMPFFFPDGLQTLHEKIGMPFVAHNRYWDPLNVYAKQNGGQYDFIVEDLAIPTEERFWVDLFRNASDWGMAVYEQDWLHNEFENINATLTSATLGRQWLLQMGAGADAAGIEGIQYCMPYPRHVMQSVEIPAVTQTRASEDYNPGNDQWSIGVSAILSHSLGLAPWKDDAYSSTAKQQCHVYDQDSEPAATLQMMVSTLSTGPVGPSDLIGVENRTNIMSTCTADGRILKPSEPATAIDLTFQQRAFGSGGPQGELWSTFSDVGPYRWHSVLSASIDAPFTVQPTMLKGFSQRHSGDTGAPPAPAQYYAYLHGSDWSGVRVFSEIHLPANDKTTPQLWNAAPELPSGHALLGEPSKFVPVSPNRFSALEAGSDGFSVVVRGRQGEAVDVAVLVPGSGAVRGAANGASVQVVHCVLPDSGAATLRVPQMNCA